MNLTDITYVGLEFLTLSFSFTYLANVSATLLTHNLPWCPVSLIGMKYRMTGECSASVNM